MQRVEVRKAKTANGANRWYFRLVAANSKVIATSQLYRTRRNALKSATLIAKFHGVGAVIVETK